MKRNLLIISLLCVFLCSGLLRAKNCIALNIVEPGTGSVAIVILSAVCPPAAVAVTIGEIIALGLVGYGVYHVHKKSKQNIQYERYPVQGERLSNCNCGGRPPRHENDKEEHPHGVYEDAGYSDIH